MSRTYTKLKKYNVLEKNKFYKACEDGNLVVVAKWIKESDIEDVDEDNWTALHWTAARGNSEVVKMLLDAGANVNALSKTDWTPLHLASKLGHRVIAECLIQSKADINAKTRWTCKTPLMLALDNRQYEIGSVLISAGVTLNGISAEGTVLQKAAEDGDAQAIKMLIDAGASVIIQNDAGYTLLHLAASKGHEEAVVLLLGYNDVNGTTLDRQTPLHVAAGAGHPIIVERLLDALADINAQDLHKETPLYKAVKAERYNVIEQLLVAGASVNLINHNFLTLSLCKAAAGGHIRLVELLISLGADVNIQQEDGKTPMHCAAESGHADIAEELIKANAQLNIPDKERQTPLHVAANAGELQLVELLFFVGAKVLEKDLKQQTALDLAIEKETSLRESANQKSLLDNYHKIVELLDVARRYPYGGEQIHWVSHKGDPVLLKRLLDHRANVNSRDDIGRTPLHVAAWDGCYVIAELLILANSELHNQDNEHHTPLSLAKKNNHLEIVDLLNLVDQYETGGGSSLHWRSFSGQRDKVERLLSNAKLDAIDNAGRTPLHVAAMQSRYEVVEILIKAGAKIDSKDKSGQTPLHLAASKGRLKSVEILIRFGAEINSEDIQQHSPLQDAVYNGHPSVVEILVKAKAAIQKAIESTMIILLSAKGYAECVRELVENHNFDVNATNQNGETPLLVAVENRQYNIADYLLNKGATHVNKPLSVYKAYQRARFSEGTPIFKPQAVSGLPPGWMVGQDCKGVLLVGVGDDRPVVYFPKRNSYGVLEGDEVVWDNGTLQRERVNIATDVAFFYGLPEMGKNLVWKGVSSDPSLFLSYYQKVKSFLKPVQVVLRNKREKDVDYGISTLSSPVEVLRIIGQQALKTVFADTGILSLRNVRGEGCSLTHDEFEFAADELELFPAKLTSFLVDPVSGTAARDLPTEYETVLSDFIEWLLCTPKHPLTKNIRVCNKLIPLLRAQQDKADQHKLLFHKRFVSAAKILHAKIEARATAEYTKQLSEVKLEDLLMRIRAVTEKASQFLGSRELKQTSFTGIPVWHKDTEALVEKSILVQLLLRSSHFNDWSALPEVFSDEKTPISASDAQQTIISYLREVFDVEFTPNYGDLLAKGYIKVAHTLKPLFHFTLLKNFGEENILVAPIKELRRVKAKLLDYKKEGANPPYAACVCDYLRATVLCPSLTAMVDALYKLDKLFEIVRVKQRIGPNDKGNKVILVNLIVRDDTIRPHKYPWSGWWDNQKVQMIAEVQITVKELFYLDKQSHHSYEIVRAGKPEELEQQQGYDGVESEMFPMSPLHTDPNCLL